ncbi:MAG: pyridoxine 5'-phosphate synthase [Pseudomonadota bacterium]
MNQTPDSIRLGVNIDHVATLRNARGGPYPDPVRAARQAAEAGADGITAHLREDRRHIRDEDIARLAAEIDLPLNFEMAATEEMQAIATRIRPHAACIVPERREERTTEGGLDAAGQHNRLAPLVRALSDVGVRVSLFIAPEARQVETAAALKAPVIELHTGTYCEAILEGDAELEAAELARLRDAAILAHEAGIEVHAGHGLTFESAKTIAALPHIAELNIGHFLIAEAVFMGLGNAIGRMRGAMKDGLAARGSAS